MPRSTIRPASTTRITSAVRTVDSRCAITTAVRPSSASASASWTAASEVLSSMGGGLVEDDDTLAGEQQPGDGHALALAAGETVTALADHGVEAVGSECARGLRGGPAQYVPYRLALRRGGAGQEQVVAYRVVEEVTVLGDHAESLAHRLGAQVADVDAADADGALVGVVQARQQLRDGGLAGAGGADEGDGLAGGWARKDTPCRTLGATPGVEGGDLLEGG